MGFFNLFKKNLGSSNPDNLKEENRLETSLRIASTEPAHRAEFYRDLLGEKLVVLTDKTALPAGVQTLEEDTNVRIATLPDGKIPVFTSTPKIFDKGVIKTEVPYLEMKGEDLFNLAKGATFILNPYSDYGKELLPGELESLLNGTILTDNHRKITVKKDTEVQIGQPADYPTDIVNSLKALFAKKTSVQAAYLGWIYNPSEAEPPHLIFALDIEGETQSITDEAGYTAYQLSPPNTLIDIIQIDDKGGLSDYFLKQTTPFYTRQQ